MSDTDAQRQQMYTNRMDSVIPQNATFTLVGSEDHPKVKYDTVVNIPLSITKSIAKAQDLETLVTGMITDVISQKCQQISSGPPGIVITNRRIAQRKDYLQCKGLNHEESIVHRKQLIGARRRHYCNSSRSLDTPKGAHRKLIDNNNNNQKELQHLRQQHELHTATVITIFCDNAHETLSNIPPGNESAKLTNHTAELNEADERGI